jgi:hypothetical protein
VHRWITWAYFAWCAVEILRLATGNRKLKAFKQFRAIFSAPAETAPRR